MSERACTVAQVRHQFVIAQTLAKSGMAFVVIPVATPKGFESLCGFQAQKLEELATAAERAAE